MKIIGIMLIKSESQRLKNKNWRVYKGKSMYLWNLEKCLMVLDEVYVSSDDDKILDKIEQMGAFGVRRPESLLDAPNISCYQHVFKISDADAFIAVQPNSPETGVKLIKYAKDLLHLGHEEVKTCHRDRTDYGSIWGMTKDRLNNYPDPLKARPSRWITDYSTDIHTIEDVYKSYEEVKNYNMKKYDNRSGNRSFTQR